MEQFSQAPVALDTQESISKLSEGVTYVVNGNKSIEAATIPVDSYVRLVNSTITGRSDGIYTVKTAIPVAPATIDNTYFNESAPISGGVANALSDKLSSIRDIAVGWTTIGEVTGGSWKTNTIYFDHTMSETPSIVLVSLYGEQFRGTINAYEIRTSFVNVRTDNFGTGLSTNNLKASVIAII